MDAAGNSTVCDRIDAALARIDAALSAQTSLTELKQRHEALREAAASSLQLIDSLIATHEDAVGDAGALDR